MTAVVLQQVTGCCLSSTAPSLLLLDVTTM
jgi:hypothetical protein